jgi:hypothetical protein
LLLKQWEIKVSTGGIGPFIIYPLGIAVIVAIWKRK